MLEGMRKPYCVASSDGRKAETMSPTGFTGAPQPLLICESVGRSQSRRKLYGPSPSLRCCSLKVFITSVMAVCHRASKGAVSPVSFQVSPVSFQ